jgi:putative endonuclease
MTERAALRRRAAETRGRRAEALAVWLLRAKGYRIIDRRWRCRAGEIDIVARRGRTLALVEVKARADADAAAFAIDARSQLRLAAAANAYLGARPALAALDLRFDVVLVAPRRWPRHLADAWRPEVLR